MSVPKFSFHPQSHVQMVDLGSDPRKHKLKNRKSTTEKRKIAQKRVNSGEDTLRNQVQCT